MAAENDKLLPLETNSTAQKPQPTNRKYIYISLSFLVVIAVIIGVVVWAFTESDSSSSINLKWFHDVLLSEEIDETGLKHGVFYKYLTLTEYEQGLYRKDFDKDYSYIGNDPDTIQAYNTLIEQSRFVNIFAEVYNRTNNGEFLDAMQYGIDEIMNAYYDTEYGGYYYRILKYTNGSYLILNENKRREGMDFLMKAFATVYRVTRNETILQIVTDLYWTVIGNYTDQTGVGLQQTRSRNWTVDLSGGRSVMQHFIHSLGKLYIAYQLAGDTIMQNELFNKINDVFDFMMAKRGIATFNGENSNTRYRNGVGYLVQLGAFNREWYSNTSSIYRGMNIGVNFELAIWWAQMMDMGVIPRNETNIWNINNMFNYCCDLGWNESAKMIYNNPGAAQTRWWSGIESIRTIAYFYYNYDNQLYIDLTKAEVEMLFIRATNGFIREYYDKEYGGVYFDPIRDDYKKGYGPDGQTKVLYHLSESNFDVLKYAGFDDF